MRYLSDYQEYFTGEDGIPLSEGDHLLSREGFWAAYYLAVGVEDEELVFSALNTSEDAAQSAYQELSDSSGWPVFTLPLSGSSEAGVIVRNFEDDNGFDCMIAAEGVSPSIRLAALEGGGFGPGLSWSELKGVARFSDTLLDRAQRLMLLAPFFGDAAGGTEAQAEFAGALQLVSGSPDSGKLAQVLVEGSFTWGRPTWSRDRNGILVCDGEYCPRNPEGPYSLGREAIAEADRIFGLVVNS